LSADAGHAPPSVAGESTTDLAKTRTRLAADRTLMAWVRTSLSMISFGFTIFKFLHGLNESGEIALRRPEEPRNIGLFLTALGVAALIAGLLEYLSTRRRLEGRWPRLSAGLFVACAVLILGFWVLLGLVTHTGPL
jgi:putative membrane protein